MQTQTITDGRNAIDPSPDQYAEFIERAGEAIEEYFDEHKSEFKGDPGDDYVLTEADKVEIAGITVEEIKPLIDGKMEFYKVDAQGAYTNISFWHDGVRLYYNDLVEKYNDPKYFLYAEFEGLTFIPSLPPVDYDPILEFICTWIYGGIPHVARLVINSDNEGKYDGLDVVITSNLNEYTKKTYVDAQLQLKASTSDLASVRESLNQKADKSEVDNKVGFTDYPDGVNAGVLKLSRSFGAYSNGNAYAISRTYDSYKGLDNDHFISKGTLENVLAERLKEPQFELIEEIVTTEEITAITKTAEPNGTPYKFSRIGIKVLFPKSTATNPLDVYFYDSNKRRCANGYFYGAGAYNNYSRLGTIDARITNGTISVYTTSSPPLNNGSIAQVYCVPTYEFEYCDYISQLYFSSSGIPSGTSIKIYGVRA